MIHRPPPACGIALLVLSLARAAMADPLTTGFTYQGQLKDGSAPANGPYDFTFILYDGPNAAANEIGLPVTLEDVEVVDGLFTVQVNAGDEFGPDAFNGQARWLGVHVRLGDETGGYTSIVPRQPVTATPYAIHALNSPWDMNGADVFNTNTGDVGLGVSDPLAHLHVHGQTLPGFSAAALLNDNIVVDDLDAVLGLYSWGQQGAGTEGSAIALGEFGSSGLTNKWSLYRGVGPDADLRFSVGTDANYAANPTVMTLTAGGNVGVGTAAPLVRAHVTQTGLCVAVEHLLNEDVIVEDTDAILGLYSGDEGARGSGITLGEVVGGVLADKWTIYRNNAANGSHLRFAYGPSANYAGNPTLLTLQSDGRVAIGWPVSSSETALHVSAAGDNFGVLVDSLGVIASSIGLHAGPAGYSSLAKNAYFQGGWQRFDPARGAFLQEVDPLGNVDFYVAGAGTNPVSWTNALHIEPTGEIGIGTGTTNPMYRLHVESTSSEGRAVVGRATAATGFTFGGYFSSTSPDGYGVYGTCPDGIGALGYATAASGENYGVYGGTNSSAGYGMYCYGRMHVNGTLSKNAGAFKIDHPLDPENKYLYHSFVESPDMKNIYDGVVVTDDQGYATVALPEWFEALNRDFRYQLTVIDEGDGWVQAKVVRKIADNRFTIRTSAAGVEVSWQVTGIRRDAYAEAHRIPVEEDKAAHERGRFLHPKLFGQTAEKAMHLDVRRPATSPPSRRRPDTIRVDDLHERG